MLDLSHIPNSQQDISIFYPNGYSTPWQTWTKPRNCQWVWIMCIGGGGGGAGGRVNITTNGSGAGCSGATTRAMFNASHLPDTLYIQAGIGGPGGASNTSGFSGVRSSVSIVPNIATTNSVLCSGAAGLNGASPGNISGGAAASEAALLISVAIFASLSTFVSVAGVGTAITTLSPTNVTPLNSQITCQGAQGAGYNTTTPAAINGGSIVASNLSPLIAGGTGTIAASTNGGKGGDGFTSWNPFFSTGGAGGGNSRFGVGGDGGKGGIGSGGGAGGSSGVTGGKGGDGGDGLVVIISF